MTQLYDGLFPEQGGGVAVMINAVFREAVITLATTCNKPLSWIAPAFGPIMSILGIFVFLSKILFASSITALFISSGVAFATLAPAAAMRWNQGFGSDEMFGRLHESLLGLQNTIGSGIGSVYQEGMSRGAGAGRGAVSGIKKLGFNK